MRNLTNPDEAPVLGDLVQTTSEGGTVVTFNYMPPPTAEEQAAMLARQWRDDQLSFFDKAVQLEDYPNRVNIKLYRAELRGWPTAKDSDGNALFPDTRPVLAID